MDKLFWRSPNVRWTAECTKFSRPYVYKFVGVGNSSRRSLRLAASLILASIIASFIVWGCRRGSFNPLTIEVDTLYQKVRSPDDQYIAKLLYRENLAMTYGFYHVTIEPLKPPGTPVDLVELTDEGLSDIKWKDGRTLVVVYEATANSTNEDAATFVKKPTSWRDVRIEYEPKSPDSREPTAAATATRK